MIGGGAAGMMAAGTAAGRGLSVLLAEPNAKLGRKLRITGKGRCNITNESPVRDVIAAVPRNPKFLYSALTAFSPADTIAFFEGIGVKLKTERGRRVFPVSDSADEVADRLSDWVHEQGVCVLRNKILSVDTDGKGEICGVTTDRGTIPCRDVILCTGGVSYPGTGSTGDGYRFARDLGHRIVEPRASLIPLISPDWYCKELAGFAPRNVLLTVWEDGKPIFREQGEMLFAHFGVTGPLVLSASAHILHFAERDYRLTIDFKPALDEDALDNRILRDFEKYKNRDFRNSLSDLAPNSLIPVVIRLSGIPPETKVHSVTKQQRRSLVQLFKAFPVHITGTRPVSEAIVTRGGVAVNEVDPRTMASRLVQGLYFAGEILDVDAYTGGYNLQIAWATGRSAGLSVRKDETYE